METPSSFTPQASMKREPAPFAAAAPAERPPEGNDRPRLPRRQPQTNLVPQLEEDPDEGQDDMAPGEATARTLAAFHKGTRRGRDGAEDL